MLINNVSPAEVATTYQSKYIMWMINSQLKRSNKIIVGLQYICYTQSIKDEAKSGENKDSGT